MTILPKELFERYKESPLDMDDTVREYCNLPDDRYYTVSIWPVEGQVRVTNHIRIVRAKKISKSDQK